eukprot:Unigene19111_Nuclearia_a/m.54269 Unigene19111_Nuclearia_a/g.54269  ORF Unigene19111_Nuclearia_a/g.54269 Unigene19111_Nuclearia_a/m.54269 type:complete len:324 (+) Unigene19111_Nuclearia_a:867-1838(+)
MKSSNTRRPLQQQAPEQQGPFFSKAQDDARKKDDVFFQTKLAVGEKDDKHEKEADNVADKVQKKAEEKEKPDVQKKGMDEEQAAGKGAAAPQSATDKLPGKGAAGPQGALPGKDGKQEPAAGPKKGQAEDKAAAGQQLSGGKDDEQKKISKKEEEPKDAAVQKKGQEEEKPIQKMSSGDKKEEDKTKVSKKDEEDKTEVSKKEEEAVQAKEAGPAAHASHKVSLEERIRQSKGKGQALPDEVKSFMETQFGADLSEVTVHTDGEAVAMNKELKARAFTNGFDIYFNEGQYKPDTAEGRKLLAHELTHVIQQTGVSKKKKAAKK